MTESPSIIPVGSLARLVRDIEVDDFKFRAGFEVEIDFYVSAEDKDNNDSGVAFYWTSSEFGDIPINADDLEIVKSATEMRNRRIPNETEILKMLSTEILETADTFEITSTLQYAKAAGQKTLEVHGRTYDGLRFGFEIEIKNIHQTDF